MSTCTLRVRKSDKEDLDKLAQDSGLSLIDAFAKVVKQARKEAFFRAAEKAIQNLKSDPKAWKGYQDEIKLWEGTLMDGLEDEPPYPL